MKAMERINGIEVQKAGSENVQYLVRAFRVMREIAIEYSIEIDPEETETVESLLDFEFEERMK